MPIAEANGREFNFPEGTTQEQMGAAIDEFFAGSSAPIKQDQGLPPQEDQRITPSQEPAAGRNLMNLVNKVTPEPEPRAGRSRGGVAQRHVDISEGRNLMNLFNEGRLNTQKLSDRQRKNLDVERIKSIPELAEVGLGNFLGDRGLDTFITAAIGLTAFKPEEFGQIISSRHPHIGITTTADGQTLAVNNNDGTVVNLNKPNLSMFDIMQGLGVVSAFTPATRVASAAPAALTRLAGQEAPKALSRIVAGGLASGATETAIQGFQEQAGGTFDANEAKLAAVFGGAAEAVGPLLSLPINKVKQGRRAAEETVEETARRELFQSEKLTPTRAQVTRDPETFQSQASIEKTDPSGRVAKQLEGQEQILQANLQQVRDLTGGRVTTAQSAPINEVVSRVINADDQIAQLYKQVNAPTAVDINPTQISKALNRFKGQNQISGGVVKAVKGELLERGLIDNAGKSTGAKISTTQAEELRVAINTFFNESGTNEARHGNNLIRKFKDALDDDVAKVKGEDIFKEPRAAKAKLELSLDKVKKSKFDRNKKNLLRDILENKQGIREDSFVQDTVFKAAWQKEDISQLKLFLNQTESGKAAWRDVRAQTMAEIEKRIFTGPLGSDAKTRALSRAKVQGVIDKLGGKIDVVLEPSEKKFLMKLRDIAGLREAPRLRGGGGGPTEVAEQVASDIGGDFFFMRLMWRKLSNFQKNRMLQRLPRLRGSTKPDVDLRGPTQAAQVGRQPERKQQQSGRNRPR